MNKLSKILFMLPVFFTGACEYEQPAAKVEYRLEDYYGYGDIQGPPAANSKEARAMQNRGVPVIIEDVSQDSNVTSTDAIIEEEIEPVQSATQVYTVSDNVGPKTPEGYTVKMSPASEEGTVNVSEKVHTVQKGETLFSIARQYDIPILPIIVVNSLEPPYAVKAGQQVKIPEGKFHTVKEGETLYSISRQYGVDMSGIVKLNDLQQPYNVTKGKRLQIPFPTELPSEDDFGSGEALTETTIDEPAPQQQVVATAEEDEGKPASLRRPTGGVLGAYTPVQSVNSTQIDTEKETQKLAAKTSEAIEKTAVVQDGKFMWPVQGKVIKKFGQQGGEYNDGINISATAGSKVKSSNSGRVVYTGNSLKSYGNMVIIKHDNGLLSAYAHMNDVFVKKDQSISKGQTIGTIGSTGKVTSPQLYFAIRKGKDAKNPMNYLK